MDTLTIDVTQPGTSTDVGSSDATPTVGLSDDMWHPIDNSKCLRGDNVEFLEDGNRTALSDYGSPKCKDLEWEDITFLANLGSTCLSSCNGSCKKELKRWEEWWEDLPAELSDQGLI